jgi:crotonobetaine/carnitine-CoA ligase
MESGSGTKPWGWEPLGTVLGLFREAVEDVPDKLFLDFVDGTFTYAQSLEKLRRLAGVMISLGLQRGDVVAVMLDNNSDAVFSWLAANTIGAIYMGVNTALKGEFLRHVLAESGARVVLAEPDYAERIAQVAAQVPDLQTVVHRGDEPVPTGGSTTGVSLRSLLDEPAPAFSLAADPRDITCLVVTGGTTGPSKLCALPQSYMVNVGRHTNIASGRTTDEVSWNPLPSYHLNLLNTTVTSSLLVKGSGYISPRFSLSRFWPEVERSQASIVSLMGAMISLVAQAPATPEMLRCVGRIRVVSGTPFPAALQQIWKDRFKIQIAGSNGYGTTEVNQVTLLAAGEYAAPGSSGKRHSEFDVRLLDDQGREVPAGESGEVVVRPSRPGIMFAGYWNRPRATLEATKDLWFHTGDIGRFDEDGYFYFVDRKKDYIRRRGENVSSYEVEATIAQHELVQDVAVHSVPSKLTEDDIKFTVALVEGAQLSPEELFAWAADRLPYFALPRYIEFRSELPKSAFGRTWKYQLRDEGCPRGTWDREQSNVVFERR